MRYFNTHGPVNPQEHYIVQRTELTNKLVAQIEQGKYCTIFAPRQTGKTTLLQSLNSKLNKKPNILSIALSFEAYESWSPTEFWMDFSERVIYHIRNALEEKFDTSLTDVKPFLTNTQFVDSPTFIRFFRKLHLLLPNLKIALVLDEFDATPRSLLSPLLQTWRTMYLDKQPPHSLHSVILVGIQNIAQLNIGRSSPFNIAHQHHLEPFTEAEVTDLLGQYSSESGQSFASGVVHKLYEQSAGQPFLVNRGAMLLTEIARVRNKTVTLDNFHLAMHRLVRESNYNFETIIRHASEFKTDVLQITFGAEYPFTHNNPLVNTLHLHGIIKETATGNCEIANPLYQRVLIDHFRPHQLGLQGAILANGHDFRAYVVDGQLQFSQLLSRFREFVERRGREAFKVTPMPREATGQYLLMAYLDIVIRQLDGDLFTEIHSGEGRLDLLIAHRGERHIVETKIWRGQASYESGLTQLAEYLESEQQEHGSYVLFHARPNVYGDLKHEELEFTTHVAGKTIDVYLVRLGHLFKEADDN